MTSLVPSDDLRGTSSANPVVSQWQQLTLMDWQSPDFLRLLSSLTAKSSRSPATALCNADARAVLNAMDELIKCDKIPSEHQQNTLKTMRELASNSGQIPDRYQVDRGSLTAETGVIASGAFTEVRKGWLDGKAVAIKTLRNDRKADKNKSQKLFCKESIIWMIFSHPNILQLIGVDVNSQTGQCSMISEMMANGNITEYIRHNSVNRHRLLEEVAAGLCYLHERGIVHGDLKGSNILITNDELPRACLADFGLATLAPSTEGATTTNTAGGTLLYMSPELLFPSKFGNQTARPTKPADIYALGMVIFEVLTGLQPFHERKPVSLEVMYLVERGERPTKPGNAEQIGFGGGTWELVEECWRDNPLGRPTVKHVSTHLEGVALSAKVVGPTQSSPEFNPAGGSTRPCYNSTATTSRNRTATSTNPTIFTNRTATTTMDRTVSPISTMNLTRTQFSSRHDKINPSPLMTVNPHHDQCPIPPDRRTILKQWQGLKNDESLDHQQLAQLIDVEGNRNVALKFGGKDAATVINTIDKVLNQIDSEETKLHALKMLRQLAGKTRQVPKSYLTGGWPRYTVKGEIIANGGVADIREGKLGDRIVAVKTFRTSRETNIDDIHKAFCKESVLWMNVSHPNILKLIAVDIKPQDKKFSMISELMTNGNIMKYIRTKEANRLCLLKDVARGLEHLHGLGIVHGDIKGPNILINNEKPPQACISDFGLSAFVPSMSFDPTTHKDGGGTFGYMAPELWNGKHTKEADIFAFGVVVYEVVTGTYAFGRRGLEQHQTSSSSRRRPNTPEDPVGSGFGEGTWEFIEKCWNEIPQGRPTARDTSVHFELVAATSRVVGPSSAPSTLAADSESFLNSSGSGTDNQIDHDSDRQCSC